MITQIQMGICKNCEDEYEDPTPSKLYKVGKELLCGDCARCYEGDRKANLSAYGECD